MIVRLPLPEWRPDLTHASGFLEVCENVIPTGDGRYSPLRDVEVFTDGLPETFQGGYSAIASDGAGYLLAGTQSDLYRLVSGSWTSLVGSLTVTGRWEFAQFGDYVVAVNGAATREVDLSSGADSAIAGAPSGTSVWVVGDYVCIGQADGEINKLRTSAFRDHTAWTAGTDQSTELSLLTGGAIQGGVGGESYGVILQRERIVRQTRTGNAEAPFEYDEITSNYGCSSGATIAVAGRTVFFHSDRGFMALDDGQAIRPIGEERVDRFFEQTVGRDNFDSIFAGVDPSAKVVYWGVPGSPGLLLGYNFGIDRWFSGALPFTGLMPGFTTSTTLEALDGTYPDIDAMTISLDDARWSGGHPRLYLFNSGGEAGTLTGTTLAGEIGTGFAELTSGAQTWVKGIRPVTDATGGLSVVLDCRQRLGDAQTLRTANSLLSSGTMPIRAMGRYMSATVKFAAGQAWDYISGLEFDCSAGGRR